MADKPYKYRATLLGHSMDVRAVCAATYPPSGIVTASRDKTIRVWQLNESDSGYTEHETMRGPTKFVSSVCMVPPSGQYEKGLIYAGSHDCAIYVFSLANPEHPVFKLLGHSGPVCSLAQGTFGLIVSGSWDNTARVWAGQKCERTLEGHQGAIWAVQMFNEQNLVLTGSADKTIRIWRGSTCERTFTGHQDCVRGLAIISTHDFLSCSNDGTVIHWQTTGHTLATYSAHNSYVYDICTIPFTQGDFVTCGEDQLVKLFSKGELKQTLTLPCSTNWAIAYLDNSNIIVGSSDGSAYVFTNIPELQATAEEQKIYEERVSKTPISTGEFDKQKFGELPGPEDLIEPGIREGQTKLIRAKDNEINVYQWSTAESKWMQIGNVIDDKGAKPSSKKITYEGKEYDYVFSVDIETGKPLKLPFNMGDDPWVAAQAFIERHNLSQLFLDQIADFIIRNSQGNVVTQVAPVASNDPFTGASRYVPGSADKPAAPVPSAIIEESHFPEFYPRPFDRINTEGITSKITEFNQKVIPEQRLTDTELQSILTLIHPVDTLTNEQLDALQKCISWPSEFVFPSLDLLRYTVKHATVNKEVCERGKINLIDHLSLFLSNPTTINNQMLALRTMCNLFIHKSGERLLVDHHEKIFNRILSSEISKQENKNVQVALATLILNYSVASSNLPQPRDAAEIKEKCLHVIDDLLSQPIDVEAQYRILKALGTLIWKDSILQTKARSLNLAHKLKQILSPPKPVKINECIAQLLPHFD